MYKVRVLDNCTKYSEKEKSAYPRDIVICRSLLAYAERLGANIEHEELEHDLRGVYVNTYIVDIGAKETLKA